MTIGSDAVTEACWPADIPQNYEELHRMFAPFIAATLRRHNTVRHNFEELYSYIWAKQVEKDVISLFMEYVREKMPQRMTAVQACAFLGITWGQWEQKQWAYHTGDPIKSRHDPDRIIGRRRGGWMPTPLNSDDFRLKLEAKNARLIARGEVPKPIPPCPGNQSKKALYEVDDIITLATMERQLNNGSVVGAFSKQGPMVHPQMKVTKAHFQSYLARSIYTDWANWCRTYKRKWEKDRPRYERETDDPDAPTWEQSLVDPRGARQETQTVVTEACERLSRTLHESMRGVDPRKCKPVEQTEMEMFELLECGVPLPDVVKRLSVPKRVRQNILKSIADIRVRAA